MADCSNTPTPESTANFDLDSRCFSEAMTSNADYTTARASDGNVKKTFAAALREAGQDHVGEWSTNPQVTESNQVIPYAGTNQLFRPLSLPYQVDSATNPDPNALLPDPSTGYTGELVDVSRFINQDLLGDYSSYESKNTEELVQGKTLNDEVIVISSGQTWYTQGYSVAGDGAGAKYLVQNGQTGDGVVDLNSSDGNFTFVYQGDVKMPLTATTQDIVTAIHKQNITVELLRGYYSNATEVAELFDLDNVVVRGAGKLLTQFPKGFSFRIVGTENDTTFSGFGKSYTVDVQNIGNIMPLIQWRKSKGKFKLHDWSYVITATHPQAGGGGIAVQYFDGCENSEVYDFYVKDAGSAGVWSGRKFNPSNNFCNYGEVYNGTFVLTINSGFPAGHNISECKSVYSHDNRYDGYKKRYVNREFDTTDPNADNIKPLFHTETIQNTAGTQGWIANFPDEGDQGSFNWSPYSGVQNNAYGLYSGDHSDGATGIDAPDRIHSKDEYFEDCHRQIHVHNAVEFVVDGVTEKAGTNQEGIFFTGLKSVAPQQPFPELVQVTNCSTPFVLFPKAKQALISNITSTQNDGTGNYPQIFAYPLNDPEGPRGGELVIGPCNLKNGRTAGMQISGYDSVVIQSGYSITNCNRAQKTDPNEGFGIGIIDGDCKYYSIGDGLIIDEDNQMTVGVNIWAVRKIKGNVSKQIDIRGYSNFSAGNDSGIYGAKTYSSPANGQWQDPGFGYYTAGFETNLFGDEYGKFVAIRNSYYGTYPLWDNATTYNVDDQVSWLGNEYKATSTTTGDKPNLGVNWVITKEIMKLTDKYYNSNQ